MDSKITPLALDAKVLKNRKKENISPNTNFNIFQGKKILVLGLDLPAPPPKGHTFFVIGCIFIYIFRSDILAF